MDPDLLTNIIAVSFCLAADQYLFSSFRANGETGVFLALNSGGRKFTPLNNNKPWIKPELPSMLMRDPWLGQGPDGMWHMLRTWGWNKGAGDKSLKIGYAESKDLIYWSAQREIAILPAEPTARNAWAPEGTMCRNTNGPSSGPLRFPAVSPIPGRLEIRATTIACML